MALATVADLLLRKDCRTVGTLVSQTESAVPKTELKTNPIVLQALEDATGEVVIHANFTKRYTEEELDALTGASRAILTQIVCEVAFFFLYRFRPDLRRGDEYDAAKNDAREALERLRQGETVFSIEANLEAGLPSVVEAPRVITGCGSIAQQAYGYYARPNCGPYPGCGCGGG